MTIRLELLSMKKINIKTYLPGESLPANLTLPQQTHSNRIVEIITGEEDLSDCDGLWTRLYSSPCKGRLDGVMNFPLGVKTADCAAITFYDQEKYGIIHAGWRGLCNGVIENMLAIFDNPKIWISPILSQFEIKQDFCYDQLQAKFGDQFFNYKSVPLEKGEAGGSTEVIIFDFQAALKSLLPTAEFDSRNTTQDLTLASWRRDKHFDNGQNVTVISSTS